MAAHETPLIVSLSPLPRGVLTQFAAPYVGGFPLDLVSVSDMSNDEAQSAINRAHVLLGDFTFEKNITNDMIRNASRLRFIQQPSVGYQNIDIEACRQKGIPVANAAGANDRSVAEHTLMLALMLLKKTIYFHAKTIRGEWAQMEALQGGIFELAGKRWGVVGMGRIGRELAKRLRAFEVEVLYYDSRRLSDDEEKEGGFQFAPLEKLLRKSDIVSLHVPLTAETRHLIDAAALQRFKPGAFLINVARGELVDEQALARALDTGVLAGAGVDVFSEEPISSNNPLLQCKNILLTPHLAGTTSEARSRIIEVSIKNIVRVLKGEKPLNVVNGVS